MTRKLKLAIQNLSYCGGCETALLDLGPILLQLLDKHIDLVYAPLLMSAKGFEAADVAFITGAARNLEDVERLKEIRASVRYLVAYGSCAVSGGVPGLANLSDRSELLAAAYRDAPTNDGRPPAGGPHVDLPELVDKIRPLEDYVAVDFVLPGCPPPPALVAEFVSTLLRSVRIEEEV